MYIHICFYRVLFAINKLYPQMHLITSVKCMINGDKVKWSFLINPSSNLKKTVFKETTEWNMDQKGN